MSDQVKPVYYSTGTRRAALLPVVVAGEAGNAVAAYGAYAGTNAVVNAANVAADALAVGVGMVDKVSSNVATASTQFGMTGGQLMGVAGMINAYAQSQAQQAAAIQQQTGYLLQARNTLAVSQVNAEFSAQYAQIQAGRTLKKAEIEARNYQIAGNQLLKNLRKTNAAMRARAAASGVAYGEGSAQAIQTENVLNVMQDVGIADLNALTAQVLGFEDVTAMLQSTDMQNTLNLFAAGQQSGQYEQAASAARQTGGLLAGATLTQGAVELGKALL